MSSYHEKVRTWAVEKLCDKPHTHLNDYDGTPYEQRQYALAECFDMDDDRLHEWDFHYSYAEAHVYSEYTADPDRSELSISIPVKCEIRVVTHYLADKEEIMRGPYAFTQILKELIEQ